MKQAEEKAVAVPSRPSCCKCRSRKRPANLRLDLRLSAAGVAGDEPAAGPVTVTDGADPPAARRFICPNISTSLPWHAAAIAVFALTRPAHMPGLNWLEQRNSKALQSVPRRTSGGSPFSRESVLDRPDRAAHCYSVPIGRLPRLP